MTDDGAEAFHGCKVALFLGEKLLVTLRDDRADIAWPAHWDFPGGGREPGETRWQTLCREVEEEVGLDMDRAEILWRMRALSRDVPGAVVWFYVAAMPQTAVRELLFGEEGQAWALMTPEAVLALPRIVPYFPPRLSRYRELAGRWGAPVPQAGWDG